MAIDQEAIKKHIKGILEALGEDPEREGLQATPERVARMCVEIFAGIQYTNHEIAEMFNTTFEEDMDDFEKHDDMVIVKDIDIFSFCEHHMILMYDMKATIAYLPKGRVIGLSKLARIADMVSRRLQLQERIGQDIAEIVTEITGSEDVAVVLEGYHGCMAARGIKKTNAKTETSTLRGRFRTDPGLQMRLYGNHR